LTLIPHHNPTEVHIFGGAKTNLADPNAPELLGGAGTYYGEPVWIRGLVQFDLSEIPEDAAIISAKLTLYSNPTPINGQGPQPVANSGVDNTLLIQRITSPWEATSATWKNQPTATEINQVVVPHTEADFLDLIDLDVTNLVRSMAVVNENNGFLIRLKNENAYTYRTFCSSKYADDTKHPKLVITYRE